MRKNRMVWLALAVGLLLRGVYAVYAQSHHFLPTSSDQYETIGINLLERGLYAADSGVPTAHREPGFPFLIAAVYGLCGGREPYAILALNCVMSLLTGLLAFGLARRLFGDKPALLTLWTWMLYPQAVYYCGYFFRETFTTLLITGLIYTSLDWDRPGRAFWGGLLAGVAGITNSGLLPAAVFSGLPLLAQGRKRWKRFLLYYAPVVFLSAAWTARNYALFGRLILGSTHGGEEFYQALVVPPEDLGTQRQTEILSADPLFQRMGRAPEAEHNSGLMKGSLEWIRAHPALYASRAAQGLLKFWRLWPYKRRYDHAYWKLVLASVLSDGWLVPLGLWAMFVAFGRRWRQAPAAPISVAATTLLYGLIHAVIRYRLPLMPAVCAFACGYLWSRAFGTIRAA